MRAPEHTLELGQVPIKTAAYKGQLKGKKEQMLDLMCANLANGLPKSAYCLANWHSQSTKMPFRQ